MRNSATVPGGPQQEAGTPISHLQAKKSGRSLKVGRVPASLVVDLLPVQVARGHERERAARGAAELNSWTIPSESKSWTSPSREDRLRRPQPSRLQQQPMKDRLLSSKLSFSRRYACRRSHGTPRSPRRLQSQISSPVSGTAGLKTNHDHRRARHHGHRHVRRRSRVDNGPAHSRRRD